MNQFKRAQVILLPTKNKSKLVLTSTPILTLVNNEAIYDLSEIKSQHLYIISDDEIKEGDWVYDKHNNNIFKINERYNSFQLNEINLSLSIKKIIATTDTSLKRAVPQEQLGEKFNDYYPLPEPSQQFIEKYIESYNKGEVITDILVEYERDEFKVTGKGLVIQEWLKINPKDNTITIKKLKNSWNREEVITNLKTMHINLYGADKYALEQVDNWIEKNL